MCRTLLIALAAGALILSTTCGGGQQPVAPQPSATPLPDAYLSCKDVSPGELIACNEEKGIALTYIEEAYRLEGSEAQKVKVNQYFLVPLRVTSADDWREKRDRGLDWDVWERLNIDICTVEIVIRPQSLMFELNLPEDVIPPECRINAQE